MIGSTAAKGYEKSADLRNEVLPFGDVGVVTPLSQKRRANAVATYITTNWNVDSEKVTLLVRTMRNKVTAQQTVK